MRRKLTRNRSVCEDAQVLTPQHRPVKHLPFISHRSRRRHTKLRLATHQKWRTQSHMLCPRNRPVKSTQVAYGLREQQLRSIQFKLPFKGQLRSRQQALAHQYLPRTAADRVQRNRCLTMNRHSRRRFSSRWRTPQIQTQIMPVDAGKQFAFGIRPILWMPPHIISGRLNRRPGRRPQWIHPSLFDQQFRDMPAFVQNRNAQLAVFDARSTAAAISGLSHVIQQLYESCRVCDAGPGRRLLGIETCRYLDGARSPVHL